jgi:nucleotide-binding universal stress UspA family protein
MITRVGNRPIPGDIAGAGGADPARTAAIMNELRRQLQAVAGDRGPQPWVMRRDDAIVVAGSAATVRGVMVAAAVDDDHHPGPVLRYAAAQARRLGVPARAVHVWTETTSPATPSLRLRRHDRMSDADQLLADVLYESLPQQEADAAERQILHDPDPVRALVALSADAALLVIGVRGHGAREGLLGGTVRRLVGRTACPLAVLPEPEDAVLMPSW